MNNTVSPHDSFAKDVFSNKKNVADFLRLALPEDLKEKYRFTKLIV